MTYDESMACGLRAAGIADLHFEHVFPVRSAYHRFRIGDAIYVRDSAGVAYQPHRIKGIYYFDRQVYYELDDRRLVVEKAVLSHDEYLRWLDPRTTAPKREAKRQLSVLKRLPFELIEVIAKN